VNGLASTPWNVAVGGTDFYYADYATGGGSAANLWNATNDANFGSLKAPLPEQPWDNPLGFNITPLGISNFSVPGAAGGGGASSCSQFTTVAGQPGFLSVCLSGYAKPNWQNAPGVPGDGVRDLPDVSLFAANGRNLTSYAICTEPNDCAAVATGEPQVFLVGGTSASAPAMAGIMALVNQKYGRQGQANFTLYALARQQPSVFHDIAMGTNDVLCFANAADCNTPVTGLPPNFSTVPAIESYGVYAAGPGYDLASGIGSVDASALVNNWNKITFLPTSTTLQISPASIAHGSPVSITTTVRRGRGRWCRVET
jgi:subtilase family serine protease